MQIFTFRNLAENAGAITKGGLDLPSYQIDFTDGIASGLTVSSTFAVAVSSVNTDVTANVVNTTSVSGAIVTVRLKTAGSGGTGAATTGDRYRIRTTVTLSNNGVLIYDNFLRINNPTYDPT